MSLINDALKKAQRLRTVEPIPLPPAPGHPGVRIAKRPHPVSVRAMLIATAGAVALLVVALAITAIMMRKPALVLLRKHSHAARPATPAIVTGSADIHADSSEPATATPAVTADSQTGAFPDGIKVPGLNPPATPPVAVVIPSATPAPAVPEATPLPARVAATVPVAPKPAAGISATTPDPKITAFLDNLKISAIRISNTNSKVLMNDRVFRLNEIVDQALGLKLTGVAADLLTFADQRGVVYTKDF